MPWRRGVYLHLTRNRRDTSIHRSVTTPGFLLIIMIYLVRVKRVDYNLGIRD